MTTVLERLLDLQGAVDVAVRAPGRANLIGEHTDYNDGFVLPVALDLSTYIVGRRHDSHVRLGSLDEPGEVVVDVSSGEGPIKGWGRYVTAVVRSLLDAGVSVSGFTGMLGSEVPTGSGLSSSAALEVALVQALVPGLDPVRIAVTCQRAENHYVGVRSGIMDQLASAAGRADHALLIDCRDNEITHVALPPELVLVVVDSAAPRELGNSAFNQRRDECGQAARSLGTSSLRDVTPDLLEEGRGLLTDTAFRRARHVVSENQRVLSTVEALRTGDLTAIGELFADSHASLARDYEVSTGELDQLVAIGEATPGVLASRMTGAGFGGCTVNLVASDRAPSAATAIEDAYRAATGLRARSWISRAAEGAGSIPV